MADSIKVKVLFFAALREEVGCSERQICLLQPATIKHVWEIAVPDHPLPEHVLVARNQEYSNLDQVVTSGDEIAFFPPVTGG
jgi:molybdopterin synthase sulfur carrier subunit